MKKVLITGATGGIGEAICGLLSKEYEIFVIGRNQSKIDYLYDKYNNIKGHFLCDLGKQNEINNIITEIDEKSFDILINNAGITNDALFVRMDINKWRNVIETNLSSNFILSNAVSRNMIKKKWGRIINITSVVGHTGNFGQANYTASKAGIVAMSKSLAIEYAKKNININCISPGFIKTDMTEKIDEKFKEIIISKIPSARLGEPEDIANAVLFLASKQSNYINGETLHVNGGLYMA